MGAGMGGSAKPNYNLSLADVATTPNGAPRPAFASAMSAPAIQPAQSGPNYNLSDAFGSSTNTNNMMATHTNGNGNGMGGMMGNGMGNGMGMSMSSPPLTAAAARPPTMGMGIGMGDLLTPSKPVQPAWGGGAGTTGQLSKSDWGDFDPLA